MKKIASRYQRIDPRGVFSEYVNDRHGWRSINGGVMKKGAVMGNHYHKDCFALFFIVSGSARVAARDAKKSRAKKETVVLKDLEGVLLAPYETHAWKFLERSSFLLLKSKKYSEKRKDIYPTEPLLV